MVTALAVAFVALVFAAVLVVALNVRARRLKAAAVDAAVASAIVPRPVARPAARSVQSASKPKGFDVSVAPKTLKLQGLSVTSRPIVVKNLALSPAATSPPPAEDPLVVVITSPPPASQPPVAKPLVTQTVTQPPAAKPPVTQPVTQPVTTQPPVTQPVTQPPAAKPPVTTQPPAAKPPVTTQPVTQPFVTTQPPSGPSQPTALIKSTPNGDNAIADALMFWKGAGRGDGPTKTEDLVVHLGSDGRTYITGKRVAISQTEQTEDGTPAKYAAEVSKMVEMNRLLSKLRDVLRASPRWQNVRGKAVLARLDIFCDGPISRISIFPFKGSWGFSGANRVWFTTLASVSTNDGFSTYLHELGHSLCYDKSITSGNCSGPPYYDTGGATHGEDFGRIVGDLRKEAIAAGLLKSVGGKTCEGDLGKCRV